MCSNAFQSIGVFAISVAAAAVPDDPHKCNPRSRSGRWRRREVRRHGGRWSSLSDSILHRCDSQRLIIFPYRGGWCPYCNAQLQDLHCRWSRKSRPWGYQVLLFLSTDQPRLLYFRASRKKWIITSCRIRRWADGARLWDRLPRRCGSTCENEDVWNRISRRRKGLPGMNSPVPSVLRSVDRSGVVRFRHYDLDYTVRLDAAHVLAAAKSAQ